MNEKFYKLTTQHYIATHNSYLQYLLDYGILGFAFFILVLVQNMVMLFKVKFYKNKKDSKYIAFEIATKASLIAWLIQGMTDNNLNNKHMIITLTILFVFSCYLYKCCEKKRKIIK